MRFPLVFVLSEFKTGERQVKETYDGEHTAEGVEKYLGKIFSSYSTNSCNIDLLRNKGIGIQNKMLQILGAVSAGIYHFEMALLLKMHTLFQAFFQVLKSGMVLQMQTLVNWRELMKCFGQTY